MSLAFSLLSGGCNYFCRGATVVDNSSHLEELGSFELFNDVLQLALLDQRR